MEIHNHVTSYRKSEKGTLVDIKYLVRIRGNYKNIYFIAYNISVFTSHDHFQHSNDYTLN